MAIKIFQAKFHGELEDSLNKWLQDEHIIIELHYQDNESGCSCLVRYSVK